MESNKLLYTLRVKLNRIKRKKIYLIGQTLEDAKERLLKEVEKSYSRYDFSKKDKNIFTERAFENYNLEKEAINIIFNQGMAEVKIYSGWDGDKACPKLYLTRFGEEFLICCAARLIVKNKTRIDNIIEWCLTNNE